MTAFTFPDELLAQHLAIIGKVGSGKTYTGKGMVERLLAAKRRVCVLDPTGVWWGLRSSADGKSAGFPIAVFGGPHADVPISAGAGAALAKIIAGKNLPSIVDLSEMLIGERHRFVTDFAEALYRDNRTPLHLVVDEADEFAPQNPLPETKRMLHHVDRIVRRGRVRGFRVMLITQRPAVLHKNVLTQANTLIALRLTAPQDRDAIKAWIEGQADVAQGQAVLDSLPRLQTGEGWVWAPELGMLQRTAFPRISTFDSSRTPGDDEEIVEPTKLAAVDLGEIEASRLADTEPEQKPVGKGKLGAGASEAEVQRRIAEALEQRAPREVECVPSAVVEAAGWVLAATKKLVAEIERAAGGAMPAAGTTHHATTGDPDPLRPEHKHQRFAVAPPAPTATVKGLRAGAVKILQELAARSPAGYTRPQVGGLTRFAHKGGTFNTYLGDLRKAGFIEERAGLVYATKRGIADLGGKVPAAPTSHLAAMALWRKALRAGAFTMLEDIVAAGEAGIARERLARQVGMAATGGTFNTYLGDLRRNGLIVEHDKRCVANDILFPMGRS